MDDGFFKLFAIYMLSFFAGFLLGLLPYVTSETPKPVVKYIYDDEARLVGFCNGKYLIRTEEDEFPKTGCMFIEPIHWEGKNNA